jgi:hypothetical protein
MGAVSCEVLLPGLSNLRNKVEQSYAKEARTEYPTMCTRGALVCKGPGTPVRSGQHAVLNSERYHNNTTKSHMHYISQKNLYYLVFGHLVNLKRYRED